MRTISCDRLARLLIMARLQPEAVATALVAVVVQPSLLHQYMSVSATLRELQTLSGQQWLDRATRTLPQALTVVLVVAIAWQLVQLTWLLLERRAPTDA